jgi:threonine dehydrogenase-like Zn-dependent dehydrogenase
MKATGYHGPHDRRVEGIGRPGSAANAMLVRIRAGGIGGPDLHMYRLGMFVALRRLVTSEIVLTP